MKWLWKFLSILSGENRFVTIEELYESVSSGNLTILDEPDGGWPGRESFIRMTNQDASVFYLETERGDGKKAETLDLHSTSRRGGAWVTFVDNDLVELTLNAVKHNVSNIHVDDDRRLRQILFKIQQAAGNVTADRTNQ
jgi:hypothetical protein